MIKDFFKDIKVDNNFYIECANKVVEWNQTAQGVSSSEDEDFSNEKFLLQIKLVEEELKEYRDAAKVNDHVELLDAAGDIFVVASYLSYMFFGNAAINDVLTQPVGDRLADDPYETFIKSQEFMDKTSENSSFGLGMLACAVTRMARDTLVKSVYNDKKVMKEILRSNYSKFPTAKVLINKWEVGTVEEALKIEVDWIEENRDYSGITYKFNPTNGLYVFFDENGKIMKPSVFSGPDIKSIVG